MTERVIVREPTVLVRVAQPGLPGPPGPPGGYYRHVQGTPAAVWTVNHNLNRRPHVAAFSVGGRQMLAEVLHVSDMQALVSFDQPTAGYAVCS